MSSSYQPVNSILTTWNCNKTHLLLINVLYLFTSIALIIVGVLSHAFLFLNASFLTSFGFSYSRYSYCLYIYGVILLPISCVGVAVVFRQSVRLTKYYILFLSSLNALQIIGVIAGVAFNPLLKDGIWSIIQDTIDQCDVTSVAHYAIEYVQMSFGCCGLNRPSKKKRNGTKVQTSCYSKDPYQIYTSYCDRDRYYDINCFESVYSDVQETLRIIFIFALVMIATQSLSIYSAVLHKRSLQRERNIYEIEFSSPENAVYSRREMISGNQTKKNLVIHA